MNIFKINTINAIAIAIMIGFLHAFLLEKSGYFVYLSIFTIGVLFYLWTRLKPLTALLNGGIFGLMLSFYALRWLFSIGQHFGVSDLVANIFIVLILLAISTTFALCALLVSLTEKYKINNLVFVIGLASSWFLAEWLRTWIFTGFPYLQTGYLFVDTALAGFMPIIGSIGTSFIVAVIAALFIVLLNVISIKKVLPIILSIVAIFFLGHILKQIDFTNYVGTAYVRVINGSISKQDKKIPSIVEKTINHYLSLSQINPKPSLVIWPESSVPKSFYRLYRSGLQQQFIDLSKQGTEVLLGTYLTELNNGIRKYNVLLVGNDIDKKYYKRHPVPFGEYMPQLFSLLFPANFLEDVSQVDFKQQPIKIGEMIISPSICFELLFPELIMQDKNTNILVNVGDLSWFENKIVSDKSVTVARVRAIESGKYLLRANNYGKSVIVNDKGTIVAQATKEEYIDENIKLYSGNTPYVNIANIPILVLSLLFLLSFFKSLIFSKFDNLK